MCRQVSAIILSSDYDHHSCSATEVSLETRGTLWHQSVRPVTVHTIMLITVVNSENLEV